MPRSATPSASRSPDPLPCLLGVPAQTFRDAYAGRRFAFRRGRPARLDPLLGDGRLSGPRAVETLAPAYKGVIETMLFDRRGVLRCLERGSVARDRLTEGAGRCHFFFDYDRQFPEARALRKALCVALDLGERGSSCRGSLHTAGSRVPRHCDGSDVVIVQLTGTRLWRFEPNSDPPEGIDEAVRMPKRLREGWSPQFGRSSRIVRMTPGSVLYLPRGWWHELYSPGVSFALTFALMPRLKRSATRAFPNSGRG